jgi:hypothetical protein
MCLLGVILLLRRRLLKKTPEVRTGTFANIVLTGPGLCVIRIDCLSFLLNYEFLLAFFFTYNNSSKIRVGKYCCCFSNYDFCVRCRILHTRYYVCDQLILCGLLVLSLVLYGLYICHLYDHLLETHKKMSPDVPMTLPLNVILPKIYFLTVPKVEKGTNFRNSL